MRAIRFRVWDKSIKKWMFGYETLGGFNFFGEVVLMGELSRISLEKLSNDDYAVMQYTGLKDKKGKEIYEGDIIRIFGYKDVVTEEGPVFWCTHSLRWKVELYGFTVDNNIEIIGNIHENQD